MKDQKLNFYASMCCETKIGETLRVGDTLELPTLFGPQSFAITSIEGEFATATNSPTLAALLAFRDGGWVYENTCFNPKALARIEFS